MNGKRTWEGKRERGDIGESKRKKISPAANSGFWNIIQWRESENQQSTMPPWGIQETFWESTMIPRVFQSEKPVSVRCFDISDINVVCCWQAGHNLLPLCCWQCYSRLYGLYIHLLAFCSKYLYSYEPTLFVLCLSCPPIVFQPQQATIVFPWKEHFTAIVRLLQDTH